jgi:hypothetical protein
MKNQKNQTKKVALWLTLVATVAILFSACSKNYDHYELVQKELTISGQIKGVIVEGPWEVSITQADENNSAFIEYNVPDKKIKAELRPNGYLHLKLYNLTNYRNVKLKANIKAAVLENMEGSVAAALYTYGQFDCATDISLSGASILDGFLCEGDYIKMDLSGSSNLKKGSFKGKRMDAKLSGASLATFSNVEVNNCKINASGSSKFTASGYAEEADYNGSGASLFYTFDLESENLAIDLSGSSNGEVTVNHKIKGTLSGASILKYKKAEDIWGVNLSGGAKIFKMD